VPFGFWLERSLRLSRNPYDRIVHFVSGVAAAILARELVGPAEDEALPTLGLHGRGARMPDGRCDLRASRMGRMVMGGGARDFLATQGDRWDTPWDMFTTVCGAIVSLLVLGPRHERQMRDLLLPTGSVPPGSPGGGPRESA
jgi:putative membrane protein